MTWLEVTVALIILLPLGALTWHLMLREFGIEMVATRPVSKTACIAAAWRTSWESLDGD